MQRREQESQTGKAQTRKGNGDEARPTMARERGGSEVGMTRVSGSDVYRGELQSWTGGFVPNSPFGLMRRFFDDAERMFESFGLGRGLGIGLYDPFEMPALRGYRGLEGAVGMRTWAPLLEMEQRGSELVVRAELPGLKKDDVEVEVERGRLTIRGERRDERREEGEGFFRSERSYGRFERSLRVPEGIDSTKCDARFENGVLEVRLELPEEALERRTQIPIRATSERAMSK